MAISRQDAAQREKSNLESWNRFRLPGYRSTNFLTRAWKANQPKLTIFVALS
jgi:hypothetical protein